MYMLVDVSRVTCCILVDCVLCMTLLDVSVGSVSYCSVYRSVTECVSVCDTRLWKSFVVSSSFVILVPHSWSC